MSWARARVRLDEMDVGEKLVLLLDEPRALRDIPIAAEAAGYVANEATAVGDSWRLLIEV